MPEILACSMRSSLRRSGRELVMPACHLRQVKREQRAYFSQLHFLASELFRIYCLKKVKATKVT